VAQTEQEGAGDNGDVEAADGEEIHDADEGEGGALGVVERAGFAKEEADVNVAVGFFEAAGSVTEEFFEAGVLRGGPVIPPGWRGDLAQDEAAFEGEVDALFA